MPPKTLPEETWPRFPGEPRPEDLTLNAPTVEEEMVVDWATVQGKQRPPAEGELYRMTTEELKKFVLDYLSGSIFTSAQVRVREMDLLNVIFMPLVFGALEGFKEEAIRDIGCIYAYMSDALGRSINGYPTFGSMRILHKDDWARVCAAIKRESDHQREIKV